MEARVPYAATSVEVELYEYVYIYIQGVAKKKWPSLKICLMWYNFYQRTEKYVK